MQTKTMTDGNSIMHVVYYTGFNKYKLHDMMVELTKLKLNEMLEIGYTIEQLRDMESPDVEDILYDLQNAVFQDSKKQWYMPFKDMPENYIRASYIDVMRKDFA